MSWLNLNLVPYIARLHILPDTQVAMQQGIQTRDLISYLSGVKCWAKRHKTTVYALKHDQMKGFDYLAPQGMYDAVNAYGLPSAIIDLDRAAQTQTRCFICTAHGITEPIIIDGLMKQGGLLSPVKSTLTTTGSLGHHYLNDLSANDLDTLIISTSNSCRADPHLSDDRLTTKVIMVEATDDRYLFACSLRALQRNTLEMERFQFAYGWFTQWSKSMAYLDFLRTMVDDPLARFENLREFFEAISFPKFLSRPPITLLRKILKQNIMSKARALISLQPIKRADTEKLDKILKNLIHRESGMPFHPNLDVLTLPVAMHGLDFPLISLPNDTATIEGLQCDLNHPIRSYRTLARIMLADWTCTVNDCIDPLDRHGLKRTFIHQSGRIPYAWIVTQHAMASSNPPLTLKRSDICDVLPSTMSLSHALKTLAHHLPNSVLPDGHALRSLRLKNVTQVKDVGTWRLHGSMIPAAAGILDSKSITAAITGPRTLVLRIDGELIGLIAGLILSSNNGHLEPSLYTDHLNSTRLIDDSRTNPLKISYTPAHTDEESLPTLLNFEADHYASSAQSQPGRLLLAPTPTFFMDEFTFYTPDRWIESSMRTYLQKTRARHSSQTLGYGHQNRMTIDLYDPTPPHEFPYTHAFSVYSALVQLYAHSGQLPTTDLLYSRGHLTDPNCRMGCAAIEDARHIFVDCARYTSWRAKASEELYMQACDKLVKQGFNLDDCVALLSQAKLLFSDDCSLWPLHYLTYFLGHVPRFTHLFPLNHDLPKLAFARLIHHLSAKWHTTSIRLAGRIWGNWQKETAVKLDVRGRRSG
ncbi:hypothetical protein B0H13DRAFT_1642863 [Mycena leptocephala]|nr:hypothetical protein B0H13DRAFT_1642863 [Mycena leptocephala]